MRSIVFIFCVLFLIWPSGPARAGCDQKTADLYGYEPVFHDCRSLAINGNRIAQFSLGWMYEHGLGVGRDPSRAARWYREGAEADYVLAQVHLSVLHAHGRGVPRDAREAAKWQGKASAQRKNLTNIMATYRQYVSHGRANAKPILERLESFFESLP